jgi:hypothetical protein
VLTQILQRVLEESREEAARLAEARAREEELLQAAMKEVMAGACLEHVSPKDPTLSGISHPRLF